MGPNYDYINKAIRDLDRVFNEVSKCNFGFKLVELIERCNNGLANQEELALYEQYRMAYPVIDSDCIVNHISHHFEDFESGLRKATIAEGRNMLADFVTGTAIDENLFKQITAIVDGYKRFKRFLAKSASTNYKDSNKAKRQKTYEIKKSMSIYFRDKIMEIVGGDIQLAFDALVSASKSDEKLVWDIMDDLIIPIISKRGGI